MAFSILYSEEKLLIKQNVHVHSTCKRPELYVHIRACVTQL